MYVAKIAILYRFYCKKSHAQHQGGGVGLRLEGQSLILLGKMGSVCFYHELNASNFLLARDVEYSIGYYHGENLVELARSKTNVHNMMCTLCPFLYLYYSRLFGGW